ncbi:hypothetical protein ElyMa_000034200 [Elysia marginata]|uniref:Uncharacterized protein n=1 Tax=Elysia marginata TaxID=1093978 RepID=A0AAV4ED13_9GAST|nr:hypothetical protein ElyMa_000034200 [Elysia marginata]
MGHNVHSPPPRDYWEFALLLFFRPKGKTLGRHVLAHCSPAGKSLDGVSAYMVPTARHRQRLQGPRANEAASAKRLLYHREVQ